MAAAPGGDQLVQSGSQRASERSSESDFFPNGGDQQLPGAGCTPVEEKTGSAGDGENLCAVCRDKANGNFFGATVCLPCKSFFIRCTKDGEPVLQRQCNGQCDVSKELRNRCQYCRFQRCLAIGMSRKEKPLIVHAGAGQELCRVCDDLANGVHFGVFTCEGCKKFFRRGLKEHQSYMCRGCQNCQLNPRNRNNCRYCRFQKCLAVGMSRDAIKMGRPRKIFLQSRLDAATGSQSFLPPDDDDEEDEDIWLGPADDLVAKSEREAIAHAPAGHVSRLWEASSQQSSLFFSGSFSQPATTMTHTNSIVGQAGGSQEYHSLEAVPVTFGPSQVAMTYTTALQGNAYIPSQEPAHHVTVMETLHSLVPEQLNSTKPTPVHYSPPSGSSFRPMMSTLPPVVTSAMPPGVTPVVMSALPPCCRSSAGILLGSNLQNANSVSSVDSGDVVKLYLNSSPPVSHIDRSAEVDFVAGPPRMSSGPDRSVLLGLPHAGRAGFISVPRFSDPQDRTVFAFPPLTSSPPVRHLNADVSCCAEEVSTATINVASEVPEIKKARIGLDLDNSAVGIAEYGKALNCPRKVFGYLDRIAAVAFGEVNTAEATRNERQAQTWRDTRTGPDDETKIINDAATGKRNCVLSAVVDSVTERKETAPGKKESPQNADTVVPAGTLPTPPRPWKNSKGFFTPFLNEEAMYQINELFVLAYSILEAAEGNGCSILSVANQRCSIPSEIQYLDDHLQTQYNFSLSQLLKYWNDMCTHRVPGRSGLTQGVMPGKHQKILEDVSRLYDDVLELSDETKYGYSPENGDMNPENPRWKKLLSRIIRNTQAVTSFALAIPGMDKIHPNDRTLLIRKDVLFSMTLLMSAREFYDASKRQFLFFWKTGDISPISPMRTFQQRLQRVGYQAHLLKLDRNECALFYALCILCHENGKFENKRRVQQALDDIYATLTSYIACVLHKDPEQRLKEVFQVIPRIRLMGFWHTHLMRNMAFDVKHISKDMAKLEISKQ